MRLVKGPLTSYAEEIEMTFFEAVAKCYRKFFIFKGRAPKSEYWWFVLAIFLFAWPLRLAEAGSGSWSNFLSFIYFFLTLSAIFPLAAVWARRMHDVGRSGWSWLYIFIPVVGFILLMRWALKEGDGESNKFGAPDNQPFVIPIQTKESK